MKLFLWLIFAVALLSSGSGVFEMLQIATNPKATVWQEMSARIQIGLSLMVAITAGGFAAVLSRIDGRQVVEAPAAQPPTTRPNAGREALAKRMGVTLPSEEETAAELARNQGKDPSLRGNY